MDPIILAIIVVTVIGLIGAVILVAASIFMYVPVCLLYTSDAADE